MRNRKGLKGIVFACGMALGGAAFAATPSAAMLGNTCAGCHGPNGSSNGPATPTIAGLSTEYFIDAMMAYKKDERTSTIMTRIAKGYSEEEIKLMAGHFGKLKFERQPQTHDAKKATLGKKLHKKYCEKCHEDGGRSTEDDAGILAGQWAPYLQYAMTDFMDGGREMPKKMKKRVEKMQKRFGDEGVEALIHYYASESK